MPAPVVHYEFWSRDPEGVAAWYAQVLGWRFEPLPGAPRPHWVAQPAEGAPTVGLMRPEEGEWPAAGAPYAKVASIADTLAAAVSHGATIAIPRTEVPGLGAFAMFLDPERRPVGLWE